METGIYNVLGLILVLLSYVLFGFEANCLALLYLILVELRYER
jgi:hypothetical protein